MCMPRGSMNEMWYKEFVAVLELHHYEETLELHLETMLINILCSCIMHRVIMFARPASLCMLLLIVSHGAHSARMMSARVQGQLPPCKDVPGGIQNWDCFDSPSTPLPPCDFKHPGLDCSTDSQIPHPPKAKLTVTEDNISAARGAPAHHGIQNASTAQTRGAHHIQGQLPPCKDVPGGIQNWDCFDPPSSPLPPCDFKHQNPGIDCSTDSQRTRPPKTNSAVTDQNILPAIP